MYVHWNRKKKNLFQWLGVNFSCDCGSSKSVQGFEYQWEEVDR